MTDDERGDGGGPGTPERPDGPAPDPLDLGDPSFSTPDCPSCLRRMEPASTPSGGVYWACLHCGQTRLA